jgi:hypothetical protein
LIAYLFEEGKSPNTISKYLAVLSYYLKFKSKPGITNNFIIDKLVNGAKRLAAGPDIRRPIIVTVLGHLLQTLVHVTKAYYQRIIFEAMFLLVFCAFLRIGEITSRLKTYQNLLMLQDVTLHKYKSSQTTVNLKMSYFKHYTSKQPVLLEIKSQAKANYCPVRKLREFLRLRGRSKGPIFCYRDLRPIKRSEFCSVLNEALLFANYDITHYKSHSFRIGATTTAHMMRIPDNIMKAMGCCHSDSFLRYISVPLLPSINI